MLKELPHRLFLEWKEFDRIEPIGDKRGDWQIASVCSLIANLAAARAGTGYTFTAKDFLLEFKEEVTETPAAPAPAPPASPSTPWQTMKLHARMHAALANAEEKRKRK